MMFAKLKSLMSSPRALRHVLWLDAASAALTGVLHLLAGSAIVAWTALPPGLVEAGGGIALLAAAGIVFVVTRASLSANLLRLVVLGNLLWVVACLWLPLSGLIAPNALGSFYTWVLGVAVGTFTLLEYAGLRALVAAPAASPPAHAAGVMRG